MAYINPKTDWEANDYLTHTDYNRIKNNLVYINNLYNQIYPNPYTFNPGPDMGIDEMFKASKWNMFEDCVEHFQRSGRIITFGERSYYEENGHMPDFNQLNRLEKCIEAYATIPVTSISLSPASISLLPGQSKTVTVTMLPAAATDKSFSVIKTSSDPFEISMNSANSQFTITASNSAAINDYSIVVKSNDSPSISTTLAVHVEQAVVSVSISGDSLVGINDTIQLTATVLPATLSDKSVTWSVDSGSSYGSVSSSGVVTGIAAGTVVIKATSNLDSTKYATKSITVQAIPVTSISVSPSTLEFDELDDTEQLTVTVLPATASNKNVTWTSSNTSVATVDANGLVTAKGSGTCTITATAVDGSGVTGTASVDNSIRIDITDFTLYPSTIEFNMDETFDVEAINILPANADPGTICHWTMASGVDKADILAESYGGHGYKDTNIITLGGKAPGSAVLRAYANGWNIGLYKDINVTVTGIPNSLTLSWHEDYLSPSGHPIGERRAKVYFDLDPVGAWNETIATSSNTSVAKIEATGETNSWYIVGYNVGTATITIKSKWNYSAVDTLVVHVEN